MYVDSENTLDVDWATNLGVDVDSIYLLRPQEQNAEEIFDMVLDMIRTGEAGLVVIDSIATLVPKAIYEESMEKSSYCGIAKSLTRFCNMVTPLLHKHRTTLIAINQVREDINNQWNEFVTPGGKGFKHHCSVRLMFQKGSFIDENGTELKRSAETPVGNIVMMSIVKTKICSPDRRTGSYTLKYATGIDTLGDIIDTGIRYGLIIQAGGWFSLANTITGEVLMDSENKAIKLQGRVTLQNYLLENITVLEDIKTFLKSAVEG